MTTASPAQTHKKNIDLLKPRLVVLLTLGIILLCAASSAALDLKLALLLDRHIPPAAVNFWADVTKIGDATPYIVVCVLLYFGGRTGMLLTAPHPAARHYYGLSRIGLLGLTSYAVSGALVHTIKFAVGRARPKLFFNDGIYGIFPFHGGWDTNSFPSGHTQSIFVIATLLALLFPRLKILLFSIAISVGFSRMAIKAHYFSDVLFGAYIAIMSVLLLRAYLFSDVKAFTQFQNT